MKYFINFIKLNRLTQFNALSIIYRVTPKKYCLIKRKMHNKKGIFKIKIVLNYQWANLNFDILVLIFVCHLAEIWMFKVI